MAEYPVRGQKAPNYWDQMLKTYIDETANDTAVEVFDDMIDDYAPGSSIFTIKSSDAITSTNTAGTYDIPGFVSPPILGKGREIELWFFAPNVYHSVANTLCQIAIFNTATGLFGSDTEVAGMRSPVTTDGPALSIRNSVFLTDGVTYNFGVKFWVAAAGTGTLMAASFAKVQYGGIAR